MHPYPHVYTATAGGRPEGAVALTSPGLPEIATAPPPEFGGPGASGRRRPCCARRSPTASC